MELIMVAFIEGFDWNYDLEYIHFDHDDACNEVNLTWNIDFPHHGFDNNYDLDGPDE